MPDPATKIAFIGFGEAAQAFVAGWPLAWRGSISAFDLKTLNAETRAAKRADFATAGITGCKTVAECLVGAKVVFSLVTADQALAAGQSVAAGIPKNCLYFDGNSCAPDTKRAVAEIINSAGGRYVDMAIMSPVFPALHRTPVLVSGPAATAALQMTDRLDMSAKHAAGGIGTASSIKMIRSIMIKGLEALTAECVLAGRKAGVEDIVLDTLDNTFPGFHWHRRAAYMLERMTAHGTRRAAEMHEVALTVEQLGLSNAMSHAATGWHHRIGGLGLPPSKDTLTARADTILSALTEIDKNGELT